MTPAFQVIADDQDITKAVAARLLSLTVTDEIGTASDACSLELDDRDAAIRIPPLGAALTVSMGYVESGLVKMGTFRVDEYELEGPERRISIRAKAADTASSTDFPRLKGAKSRSWDNTTVGAIIAKIAGEHGYTSSVDPDLAAIQMQHKEQPAESDSQFLYNLALDINAVCKIGGGKIVVTKPTAAATPSGKAMPTVPIKVDAAISWRMRISGRAAHKSVKATSHNFDTATADEVSAGEYGAEDSTELPHSYPTEEEATLAAQSKLGQLGRGSRTLSLTLVGDPRLGAQVRLVLSGFRSGVDGTWSATKTEHRISGDGYVTEVEAQTTL